MVATRGDFMKVANAFKPVARDFMPVSVTHPVVQSIPSGGWLDPVGGGQDLVDSGARWQAGGSSYLFMPR
jgi:hypothetical protein